MAVLPWLVGTALLGWFVMGLVVPKGPDRVALLARRTALLLAMATLGLTAWIHLARMATEPVSPTVSRDASFLGPGARLLLPNLREAQMVVPDRPHNIDELPGSQRITFNTILGSLVDRLTGEEPLFGRRRTFNISTNERGFRVGPPRGGEVAETDVPAPGYRVICLGDSIAFSWGVEHHESYPALLAEHLEIEVVNAAVPAMDMGALTNWAVQALPKLDVDLVLVTRRPVFTNPWQDTWIEHQRGVGGGFGATPEEVEAGQARLDPTGAFVQAVRKIAQAVPGATVGVVLPPVSTAAAGPGGVVSLGDASLIQQKLGIPVLELTTPFRAALAGLQGNTSNDNLVTVEFSGNTQQLVRVSDGQVLAEAQANDPTQLSSPILRAFEGNRQMREPLFNDGSHPDAEGYELFAQATAEWVQAQGWVTTTPN
ncbi:MAG: hypothetical protein QGG40_20750, partial [Myxococcota bacterium]|nr:hypothetical protein [Myxococcota bacterium]